MKRAIVEKVVAGLILSGILYGCSFIPGFYPAIWKYLKNVGLYILATTPVPRWFLFLLLGLALILLLRALAELIRRISGPSLYDYDADTVLGLVWRWDNSPRGPRNLWCFCPSCDTALIYDERRDLSEYGQGRALIELKCEHCGTSVATLDGDREYLLNRVLRQIDRTQRSGDWRKRISRKAA